MYLPVRVSTLIFSPVLMNNVQKPVTLETGITVQVPLFIKTGEKIKVDTRTGKYMERA